MIHLPAGCRGRNSRVRMRLREGSSMIHLRPGCRGRNRRVRIQSREGSSIIHVPAGCRGRNSRVRIQLREGSSMIHLPSCFPVVVALHISSPIVSGHLPTTVFHNFIHSHSNHFDQL